MRPIAGALIQLGQNMQMLAEQQGAILSAIESQNTILRQLAAKNPANPDIKVAAPNVNMPPRPTEFSVEFEKNKGETVGMRIRAESPS